MKKTIAVLLALLTLIALLAACVDTPNKEGTETTAGKETSEQDVRLDAVP